MKVLEELRGTLMNLLNCRKQFHAGYLDKQRYIDEMYTLHQHLFDYTHFIKKTDISHIAIQDDHLVMTIRSNGLKILCESLDKRAAPIEILNFNYYERKDADVLFKLIKPYDILFDIGANIGWYTMNMAHHDKTVVVHAFEPIPSTFILLNKNIKLNKLSNIYVYNFGFSDKNQKLFFYVDNNFSANASAKKLLENNNLKKIKSSVKKIDDFFYEQKIKKLDFIKCDVEGAELMVYIGGFNVISEHKPIIFTEMLRKWSAKFNYHPNDIVTLLSSLGYRCFTAKANRLIEFFIMDESTIETNFFFLHKEKHLAIIQELKE